MSNRCSANLSTRRAEEPEEEDTMQAAGEEVEVAAEEAATNANLQAPDGLEVGMCKNANRREHINTDLRHQLPRF